MCEIIRTMIGSEKFPKRGLADINLKEMNFEFLDQIDCYGQEGQTRVCAVNGGSFNQQEKWIVLFDYALMTFNTKPQFEKSLVE